MNSIHEYQRDNKDVPFKVGKYANVTFLIIKYMYILIGLRILVPPFAFAQVAFSTDVHHVMRSLSSLGVEV